MRRLAWDASFRRAFRRRTRNNVTLRDRTFQALTKLAENPFDPALRSHKLSGQLKGLWACWVEYYCRLVFAFEPDPDSEEDMIVLVDLGTHDEVY